MPKEDFGHWGKMVMAISVSDDWWVGSEPADIQDYLEAYTESEGGYLAKMFRQVVCSCGSERFNLERASEITRRVCLSCGDIKFICRKIEDWEEAESFEDVEPYACVDCGEPEANIVVGFARYDENPKIDGVKWFFVGVRCADCGILCCFNDGKIGWGPATAVFESV